MTMNIEKAVEYMKQSVSVQDWNERRKVVFSSVENPRDPYLIEAIEGADRETGTSLIVRTLGKD